MVRPGTPSGFGGQQTQQTTPPEVGARKRASYLEASTVQGSAVQGKARAKLRATLTNSDNLPLTEQPIHFYLEGSGKEFATVATNSDGVAEYDTGQHISDVQTMVFGAASGYIAEYKGSANFSGSKAVGSFNVTL